MDPVVHVDLRALLDKLIHVVLESRYKHWLHELPVETKLISKKRHVIQRIRIKALQDEDNWYGHHWIDKVPEEVIEKELAKDSRFEFRSVARL